MSTSLVLLDTASLYYRAFFGYKTRRSNADGIPCNAIAGLVDMVATLVETYQPSHLVPCWDDQWRPSWRIDLIPDYKAHRVADDGGEDAPAELTAQLPGIVACLTAAGIPPVGLADYEADDVIGTLATRWVSADRGLVSVVTGDRDLFQLVDDAAQVRVIYPQKGVRDVLVVDQDVLKERYGAATGRLYEEIALMRGDSSDGLPGVKGIGDKTAKLLIEEFGSLAAVEAAASDPDSSLTPSRRRNIVAAKEYLEAARVVVRVARDAPLRAISGELPTLDAAMRERMDHVGAQWAVEREMTRLAEALTAIGKKP